MIEFRKVSFRYPGSEEDALSDVSFAIPEAQLVAMMGSNGSGKSTAVLCMNGIHVPSQGSVLVDGLDTSSAEDRTEIRRRVGVVFQDPNTQFTSMSVERELAFGMENIGVPRDEMHERVDQTCREFGLDRCRDLSPADLSGGERQRVAVASVVILRPKYLVLDEATTLLSPKSRKDILNDILAGVRSAGTGVVLVTQFPEEAESADRIIVFHRGSVLMDGPPDSVFARSEELAHAGVALPAAERLRIYGF